MKVRPLDCVLMALIAAVIVLQLSQTPEYISQLMPTAQRKRDEAKHGMKPNKGDCRNILVRLRFEGQRLRTTSVVHKRSRATQVPVVQCVR
jgi:hypothetical protein